MSVEIKIIVDTMFSHIDFQGNKHLVPKVRGKMHFKLGIKQDGAIFSKAYKLGVWDGITDFYDMKEDTFHTGLLPQVLEGLRELQSQEQFSYKIHDKRPTPLMDTEDTDSEIVLGNGEEEDIILRDYQYDSVVSAIDNQVGVVNLATNAGKCLTKDTRILTEDGYKTIEDIFEENGTPCYDTEKIIEPSKQIKLINRYGKPEKVKYLTFNGSKEVLNITSKTGLEQKVTLNHPLLTVSDTGKFVWKKAELLKVGDKLVTRVGDNVFGNDQTITSRKEAYCIGAIVADGYIGDDRYIDFCNSDVSLLEYVGDYFKSLSESNPVREVYKGIVPRYRLYNKKLVKDWHRKLGLTYGRAKDKKIPACIMSSPRQIQLDFLAGYLECKGYIDTKRFAMEVVSSSKELIQQVQLILKNLGIVSTLRDKKVKGYENNYYGYLNIKSNQLLKLSKTIEFRTDRVIGRLQEGIDNYTSRKHKPHKMLTDGNIYYDTIEYVESKGSEPTFDVSMERTSSFIAESIVNHNTEVASGIMQQIKPYLNRGDRIGFFCNSLEIFHQSAERIKKRLNLRDNEIGMIGDGKFNVKNRKVVFVMIPTLNSGLKDPKKDVKFTPKERVIKFIAEEVASKFKNSHNTRHLLQNYIKNCSLTTKVWQSAEEQLMYIAYSKDFNDKTAKMQLNKYVVELDKIIERKNKKKFKKYKEMMDFVESVKVAIHDEAHEINGDTIYNTMSKLVNAQYRIALTGTVDKSNKMMWQKMQAVYNQIICKVSNDHLIEEGYSSRPVLHMVTIKEPKDIEVSNNYMEVYQKGIVENEYRNDIIAKLVQGYVNTKPGGVLISVSRLEHGENIQRLLKDYGIESDFTHGELAQEDREEYLRKFSNKESRVLIASSILDQGVDVKSIGMLVLASGGKSLRQNLQRIGRGLRLNGIDGNQVIVFDFIDKTNKYLLDHSKKRMSIYDEENFHVREV